ncbi:ribosomal protein S21e [Dictyocaulus viviparus]|uniref:Derlin n=1 Tax=Dictyocaulus viviparus TaxID=29172 RepID=A0A0D8YE95_DICVI|nr:ribosomal protein S21e [Dictyocaulus viviparus]
MPSDLSTWFASVPIVTRYWFAVSVVVPLLGRFGLINPLWMYLDWDLVVYHFQASLWRPITALIFYPVTPQTGFHWLLMLYFLYNYSKNLETGTFSGRPADYLYMLIFNWLVCAGISMAAGVYFLLEPMVLSVLYVWCQLNKDTIVSFWFGTTFKVLVLQRLCLLLQITSNYIAAIYLPWILCAFNAILRGGGMNELLGILVGHTYYFLAFDYPLQHGGMSFLQTPRFLYSYLPNEEGGVHGFGADRVNQRRGAAAGGRYFWGRGQALSFIKSITMQNDAGEIVELYVPRKCSSSNRLIGPKDHSSIQIDIVDVDPITGRMVCNHRVISILNRRLRVKVAGKATRYAICGALRRQGESDDAILRLAQRDGIIPKNL